MLLGYGTGRGCGALGQVPRLRIASVLRRRVSGARPPRTPHHPLKVACAPTRASPVRRRKRSTAGDSGGLTYVVNHSHPPRAGLRHSQ
jgi:hypothetical protein